MSPKAIEQILIDNQRLQESNSILKSEVACLKDQLAELLRMIYGQKRERFVPDENQTSLDLGLGEDKPQLCVKMGLKFL